MMLVVVFEENWSSFEEEHWLALAEQEEQVVRWRYQIDSEYRCRYR
jgi:hypothetical protein